jgi:hypothetical protein
MNRWLATKCLRGSLRGHTRLGEDRDDPTSRVAGPDFHDRTDQSRDEPSLNRQGRFLTAMLVKAAAPRDFWISRLERSHIDQAAARETVPNGSFDIASSLDSSPAGSGVRLWAQGFVPIVTARFLDA